MNKTHIVGNWKSNKTIDQAREWLDQFRFKIEDLRFKNENIEIVICPAFIHLPLFSAYIQKHHLPLKLAAQDISPFGEGAFTGAVAGSMLEGIVSYVLIGHSERRTHFGETDEILAQKVSQAKQHGIEPIYCVSDVGMEIPSGVTIAAYEPVWAIGSGTAETPDNANEVCKTLKEKSGASVALYGGSVTGENASQFTQREYIDGVLPGGASLEVDTFIRLIQAISV